MKSFIHSIPKLNLFQNEEKIARENLARIEREREERGKHLQIIEHYGRLKDKLVGAKSQFDATVIHIDRLLNWPTEALYADFIEGRIKIEVLGERIADKETIARHEAALKKALHASTIGRAETDLANFEKQYAKMLEGINLEMAEEAPAVAAKIAPDHFINPDGSAKLVRDAVRELP